jgi:type IV pilus assembly protein PilY1
MTHLQSLPRRYLTVIGIISLVFLPGFQQALAAPGTLSQVPLYVGPAVEPNVLYVADDSHSMDWSVMTPDGEGEFIIGGLPYFYTQPAPGNLDYWVVASEEHLLEVHGLEPDVSRVWRAWTHHYNRTYYNPEVTYEPWIGFDKNGAPFDNANPSAARVDPYNPDAGTVDLVNPNTTYLTDHPNVLGSVTVTGFYPARYYIWKDTNGNGIVDVSDDHVLVEITNIPTAMTPTPPASYTGGPNRSDCAAAPVCSYAEEIRNFANWFSYHRKRDLIAKNAATRSIAPMTGARVGYATINNNNNARIGVASMNLSPDDGNKRALFDKIYQSRPGGGTPLRRALDATGRYFECVDGNIMNASGAACPILPANEGGTCQKNATILMTDGFWNGSPPNPSVGNADNDGDNPYAGWPYGDDYVDTLADVAMHYFKRDLHPNLADEVPVPPGRTDLPRHQHMLTFSVAFGVTGTLDPKTADPKAAGFSWPNPYSGNAQKIDDLWHAAYNGRGEFFSAFDPASLRSGLRSAFEGASRGRSTSASVAFNTTKLGTDNILYQASFNPSKNWSGDLTAIGLAIDGSLTSQVWSAAEQLDQTPPANRQILTWDDETRAGVPFRTFAQLSTRQRSDLNTGPGGAPDAHGQARLDYLRGDRSNEGTGLNFRVRNSVLGDIVYSNPVFVGRPELGYDDDPSHDQGDGVGTYSFFRHDNIDRPEVIYVGANDGMLHGFSAVDGSEVLAYVPNRLFSANANEGLHYLTNPAYDHRYYVDLSPTVSDVYINGAWRTILVGGYRAGGRGIFALDITNPASFSETNSGNIVLWEFTDEDHNGLGHSFSKPTIAQMEDGRFAVVFGNGYNDLGDGQAKLYILYIENGMDGTWSAGDYRVITTGVGSPADRNGLSTPALVDTNKNGRADRVYAGDLKGNLWAFDLKATNPANWGIAYTQAGTPKALFNANIGGVPQPITAKPVVARNPAKPTGNNTAPNILVFFGTGQYIVDGDKTSTDTQTFYGVWDDGPAASGLPRNRTHLVAQTVTQDSTADLRVTTDNFVNYDNLYGWYFDLPTPGERVVVDPRVRGDYVFFNTLIPEPGTCASQGYGWLMALKLVNGGMPNDPVFDVNNDGKVNENDLINGTHAPSGVRLDGIPAGSNFLADLMYTPDDMGNIDIRRIDAGTSVSSGRTSWREMRQ